MQIIAPLMGCIPEMDTYTVKKQFNFKLGMFSFNNNNVPSSLDAPHVFCGNTPLHLRSAQTFSVPLSLAGHHVTNNLRINHRD